MLRSGLYNLGSFVLEGMDDALLNSLSKEEIRFYKLFVGRTNQSKERKVLKLFDIIKKSKDAEYTKKAIKSLGVSSNNFYQLKKEWIQACKACGKLANPLPYIHKANGTWQQQSSSPQEEPYNMMWSHNANIVRF